MSGFFADGRWVDVTAEDQARIAAAVDQLAAAGCEAPLKEAQALFATTSDGFEGLVAQRRARVPLSHLVGYRDFYKHRFFVTADVLDPRPETETLVEVALGTPFQTVLDLGVGSGCILLSLLAERPTATGVGGDLSRGALAVAERNAKALGVADRTALTTSDWYSDVTGMYDLIVSNPPYIAINEMAALQPEVRNHEPRLALTDEGDGLSCYRAIIAGAPKHLSPGGRLAVEIGPTQAKAVAEMMARHGFAQITVVPDLDGRDRVVSARIATD